MKQQYDVIIIGSGPGAMAAAYALTSEMEVAVVEADAWGGTCPNRGCDPKKVLYAAAAAQQNIRQLQGCGFATAPKIHWEDLMKFKETFTQPVSHQQKQALVDAGIITITGTAKFIDAHTIAVDEQEYQAQLFILATGQRPALLDIPGKEYFKTSNDFLAFSQLPQKIAFVGGGYISFELANIANSCGSEVHVLHHNQRPLKGFDEEYTQELVQTMTDQGIHFHWDESVAKITKQTDGVLLQLTSQTTLKVDEVICATGRIPNISDLNLAAAEVSYSKKGIKVNEFLQTTNPAIYALGDCLEKSTPKLTPIASFEGSYLAKLLAKNTSQPIQYPVLPTIAFCLPQLAQVGVTTAEATENPDYDIRALDMSQWFTYKHLNEKLAKAKIIVDKKTDLVVGATVLSNEAEEVVNLLTLIIANKLSAATISQQVMLYPTIGSDLSYLVN
jgi:glutathione reductase (NADPH)